MPKKHLRVLAHNRPGERISLIWSEVMTFIPSTTDHFLKIVAGIQLLVFGRKIVENFGRRMNTCRGQAQSGLGLWFLGLVA